MSDDVKITSICVTGIVIVFGFFFGSFAFDRANDLVTDKNYLTCVERSATPEIAEKCARVKGDNDA